MSRLVALAFVLALAGLLGLRAAEAPPATELKLASAVESKAEYTRAVAPFLTKHCAVCHNAKQAKGDLDTAIELTKRHIQQAPEDILAHTNLSMFYQKKGLVPEAEAAGAEARRLDWKRQLTEGKKA